MKKIGYLWIPMSLALSLSACGMGIVNKQNLINQVNTVQAQVAAARSVACSDDVTNQINTIGSSLNALITALGGN